MKTNLFLIIFFFCINVNAQISFQENTIFNSDSYISNLYDVSTADIDNDGDEDIIISSAQSNANISWYENLDGKGDFGPFKIIGHNPNNYTKITSADINNDGLIDIIAQSKWYRNVDGNGTFEESTFFAANDINSQSINTADIDGDGDLDILLDKSWYENTDGLGQFVLKQVYYTNQNDFTSSSIGDIDGDGDLDIATVVASTNRLSWFENLDGLGNFGAQQYILSLESPTYVSIANVDGDGDMDIVTCSADSGELIVHKNQGNNQWNSQVIYANNSLNFTSLNVKDIDGDGDIDISISYDDANYRYYRNLGNGNFEFQFSEATANTFGYNANIDGDDDKDLITVNCNNRLEWIEFPNDLKHHISNGVAGINVVNFSDLDNDGDLDVISNAGNDCDGTGSGKIVWYENIDGFIDYDDEEIVRTIGELNLTAYKILTEDLDNDNDEDVFVLDYNRIFVFSNNLNEKSFIRNQIITLTNVDNNSRTFDLGDVDSDGDIDIIGYYNGTVWFENVNGRFDIRHVVSATTHKSLNACDIDNDGDIDIVFGHGNEIGWYENIDGIGNFSSSNHIGAINIVKDFTVCSDIDGDLDIDVLSFDDASDTIILFENLNGSFSTRQTLASGVINAVYTYLTSFMPLDIDNDGNLDIVCSSYNSSTSDLADQVYWFQNLGSGNAFGEKMLISHNNSKHIDSGDFDNDGDMDLISVYNDEVIIYKNLLFVDNIIHGVVNYDINGDGCNSGNYPISNQVLITADNGNDKFSAFPKEDGSYQLLTNEGDFTINVSTQLPSYLTYNPNLYNVDFIGLDNVYEADFCIQPISSVNDLNVIVYPLNDSRPGFDSSYQIVYKNVGTTQLEGTIVFEFDVTKLSFLTASEPITLQTVNSFTFNYSNLNPFETRTIDLKFNVFTPPTTNIGDILNFTATISPVSGDNTESNNVIELNQTVIGSYDPNDIAVLEGNQILIEDADEYLHYIIRFQNTGTASAINVKVDNLLDNDLDWTTLQLESSSHTNRVEIIDGNEVSFIFNGIYLPDSTSDEPNSHGFIAYKIKPKSDVVVGDILPNKANIFFDFNPAIETNMVTTEITSSLSVNENLVSKFYLYPNPTNGIINVDSATKIVRLEVYNNIGQVVLSELNKAYVDTSILSAGLYFIKVEDVLGNLEIKKIIKN